jgi:hypothetical protein
MYGLVNRAVEDLVKATAGDAAWDSIKAKVGQSDLQFLDTKNYDDQLTLDLVAACSELMDLPQADVIRTRCTRASMRPCLMAGCLSSPCKASTNTLSLFTAVHETALRRW